MYKHKLKVYDENLLDAADISQTATSGVNPVFVGGTQNALVARVFAETAVVVAGTATAKVLASSTKTGSFVEVATKNLPTGTYAKDDMIAEIILPLDIAKWGKANLNGNSSCSGEVIVTLGYVAR